VAERLTDRMALLLESGSELSVFVERLRRLVGASLLEPRFPVGDEQPGNTPRHGEVLLAVLDRLFGLSVEAALLLCDGFGDVGDVDDARLVEMRPVVERHDDVGAGPGLDGGRDPRLKIVGVDRLELDLDPERLAGLGKELLTQYLVAGRD